MWLEEITDAERQAYARGNGAIVGKAAGIGTALGAAAVGGHTAGGLVGKAAGKIFTAVNKAWPLYAESTNLAYSCSPDLAWRIVADYAQKQPIAIERHLDVAGHCVRFMYQKKWHHEPVLVVMEVYEESGYSVVGVKVVDSKAATTPVPTVAKEISSDIANDIDMLINPGD
ncbi:hypothetical protein [Streptomyces fungicidicus]|uniref:hypothetical protein n=1 Tax=Streptomyces fungicidicus TaxID=68203 RepID=UPI00380F32B4